MSATNSVQIEGRVQQRLVHYPAREGKKEFLSFEIGQGKQYFVVQAYEDEARKAIADGITPGQWVYVRGCLRMSKYKGKACGAYHRGINVVAAHIEIMEASPRERPDFTDEGSIGRPPEVL